MTMREHGARIPLSALDVIHRPFPTSVIADEGVTLRLARDSDAELISGMTRAPEVHRFWGGRAITVREAWAKYTGRRAPEVVSYVICERAEPVGYLKRGRGMVGSA
jgi:hypothetical protein